MEAPERYLLWLGCPDLQEQAGREERVIVDPSPPTLSLYAPSQVALPLAQVRSHLQGKELHPGDTS